VSDGIRTRDGQIHSLDQAENAQLNQQVTSANTQQSERIPQPRRNPNSPSNLASDEESKKGGGT